MRRYDPNGELGYEPPIKDEPDPPVTHQQTPPAITATSAPPPNDGQVTPGSVANTAMDVLPKAADAAEIARWLKAELPALADQVLAASGVNLAQFDTALESWAEHMKDLFDSLNSKDTQEPEAGVPCPPLPGACNDPTCRSLFDVNELAIRGRKSIVSKRIYMPMIFPDFRLDSAQRWGFGQKVEFDQEWRHQGFTLGNLISSFSLLPSEELTVEVSSWQRTKSEVQSETDETTRKTQEQDLKRSDEESVSNEAANQSGWTVSATAAVSYGPVSASVSAGGYSNSSDRVSAAQRKIQESTQRATSEVSSRRAVKISHTKESGEEQKSVRRMRNPNLCHTVTFNFFQVIKLFDVQMHFLNDAPVIYLPGLFPANYSNGVAVRIPYELVEGFTSPAVFLTQFFDADRDLSQEIYGYALRVRMDVARSPSKALRSLASSLLVATKTLLNLDPTQHIAEIGAFIASYAATTADVRAEALKSYGVDSKKRTKGETVQVNTPGVYVDSLLGRCSACEDTIISEKYVAIERAEAERLQVIATNVLLAQEAERRRLRLAAGDLTPFDPPAAAPAA